jgi:predicted dehydrogenase
VPKAERSEDHRRPRLGFLGVGWIGKHRMEAIAEAGVAEIAAIADPSRDRRQAARAVAPKAHVCENLGHLLELPLDGIVIATPSALHAEQAIAALGRGCAVFCQKPLARTGEETRRVVEAAAGADRLLACDLSYRQTTAMRKVREVVRAGGIGRPFAVDLTFHNAYGPDAAWFYDRAQSGGGCVIDLGVHLVDLAMWLLDYPVVEHVDAQLFCQGQPARPDQCEDYAVVQMKLAGDIAVRLACSWRVSAGRDAVIEAAVYGSQGGVALKNVDGSFFDFVGEQYRGTQREQLASYPDAWGGRAAVAWAQQLAEAPEFDTAAVELIELADALDAIYEAARCAS